MGIKEDAGELLAYFYNRYTENKSWTNSEDVIEETKWESGKINRAIDYLKDLNLIKITLSIGNTNGVYNFGINGLTPFGIEIVENKSKFKSTFGFEIGIPGLIKFSWKKKEK